MEEHRSTPHSRPASTATCGIWLELQPARISRDRPRCQQGDGVALELLKRSAGVSVCACWFVQWSDSFCFGFFTLLLLSNESRMVHWHERWLARLGRQSQSPTESAHLRRAHNPAFIPRNHLVEAALAAGQQGDLALMERLLDVLTTPYDHSKHASEFHICARDWPRDDHG